MTTAVLSVVSETPGRMSPADYRRERDAITTTFGSSAREASSRFDQSLVKLFHRSGWTQEQLAQAEGVSQQHIQRKLVFARFLAFSENTPPGVNPETPDLKAKLATLTEKRFREYYWSRTDKAEQNERIRFRQVVRAMTEPPRPSIRKPLLDQFGDGQWHKPATMARHLGTDEPHVIETLRQMAHADHATKAKVEKRRAGKGFEYRTWKLERSVGTDEIAAKLTPIADVLRQQARKAPGTVSNATVMEQAGVLLKLIEAWRG